ncbi:hypothetical protein Leryth_021102 [Lithospermum erythrorhizon]|nr:hypothetical protein Leryth_021102 [Lithospermum erythrorhizon]
MIADGICHPQCPVMDAEYVLKANFDHGPLNCLLEGLMLKEGFHLHKFKSVHQWIWICRYGQLRSVYSLYSRLILQRKDNDSLIPEYLMTCTSQIS